MYYILLIDGSQMLQDPSKRRYWNFEFVVPQSDYKLPSWFINQSSTASITIKLDPNRANSELIGVAMVFCFRANSSVEDDFWCEIRDGSGKYWKTTVALNVEQSRTSDHLFLHYNSCENVFKTELDTHGLSLLTSLDTHGLSLLTSLDTHGFSLPTSWDTLEFSFFSARDKRCSSCEPCGVRLVYEEDIKELKEITNKYINDQKDVQSSHSRR